MARIAVTGRLGEEIAAANRRWMEAYRARDVGEVAALYTEDAWTLAPNAAPVIGREAIGEYWRAAMESGSAGLEIRSTEVAEMGELAYEVGATTLLGEGGEAIDHFNYMVIWKRSSGEILIHREIWNSCPAPAGG